MKRSRPFIIRYLCLLCSALPSLVNPARQFYLTGYVWNSHKNKKSVGAKSVPNYVGNWAQWLLILMRVRFAADNSDWMDPSSIGVKQRQLQFSIS